MAVKLVTKRLLQGAVVMFLISFVCFLLLNVLPGTSAQDILGENATPDAIRVLDNQLHLNRPFFERYYDWLTAMLSGHPGSSYVTGQPITTILAQRLPVTAEVVVLATILALAVAIPVALVSAYRSRAILDRLGLLAAMSGLSLPPFAFAIVLILIFAIHLHLVPATGFVPLTTSPVENLKTVILPAATVAFGLFATYSRVLRADLIDQLNSEEYVLIATAKGLSRWRVLTHHVLRNSLFPLMTIVGVHFGTVIAGTVIVEQVFALPGVGQELISAITVKDIPVVECLVVLAAACVVCANLLTDLLYIVFDPRVRDGVTNR